MSYDKHQCVGRLTEPPLLLDEKEGKARTCFFKLAVPKYRHGEEYPIYFKVVCWGRDAIRVGTSFDTGDKLLVDGELFPALGEWNGKPKLELELVASKIELVQKYTGKKDAVADEEAPF